jgi:PPE-repeat protein
MSFLTSPPEIISSLLHAGAGPAPMLAASAAWDGLAVELGSAAQSFSSITSGLAGDAWQGAASAAMLSTASQYAASLNAAATQAQTAAAQAQAVASEFESALAATVHPVVVAANRNELVQLVFSNLFGQNAPAIAAAEAEYEQMWAQDVSAMVGYHGGVSAAAAQLSSWASAVQALPAQASAAIARPLNPAAAAPAAIDSLTSAASNPIAGLLGRVETYAIDVINFPTDILFGRQLIPTGPQATGGFATINGGVATAPLTVVSGTEPIVNASVGTGSTVPLLVDTGSKGLVIPFTKVGGLLGVLQLGIPIGGGIGGYSGGLDYLYLTYNAPVNFGGGLITASTPVNVEFLAFPVSIQSAMTNGLTFQSFFASDSAAGVLGVGPNATGPGPSNPLQALPSPYNSGLLIDQHTASPYLQFGGTSTLGGAVPIAQLTGSPITDLNVTVGNTTYTGVPSIVDSGGVEGTLPSSLNAVPGQQITVKAPNGAVLYQYTYNGDYFPTPISSGLMNTGNLIFQQHPVYIDYGADTSTIY